MIAFMKEQNLYVKKVEAAKDKYAQRLKEISAELEAVRKSKLGPTTHHSI